MQTLIKSEYIVAAVNCKKAAKKQLLFCLMATVCLLTFHISFNAQEKPLTLSEILVKLDNGKSQPVNEQSLESKNAKITEEIRRKGIDFVLLPKSEDLLKRSGANFNLVELIRGISQTLVGKMIPTTAEEFLIKGIYCKETDLDCKIDNNTKAIKLNGNFANAYFNRGLAYLKKRNYREATIDFDKAIELFPNNPVFYYQREVTDLETGNYTQAIPYFTTAIK